MSVLIFNLLLVLFVCFNCEEDDIETTTKSDNFCRQRVRPITTDKDDLFNLAEATYGEKIMLYCHFCGEDDDGHPKNWFKLDKMNDLLQKEVDLGMHNNMSLNRIHTNIDHSLTIHNVTDDDAGEYFCKGLDDLEVENKYNYFVDVILDSEIQPETGNYTAWKKYHDEQYAPINKLLNSTSGPEYDFLQNDMHLSLELVTEWDSAGPCEICGRPKGDGRRRKKGHCRFKIKNNPFTSMQIKSYHEKLLQRATHLSCRSITLQKLIPGIINTTMIIPDFVEIEMCDGTCNPDAEGLYSGWRSTKKKGFKYRKTFVLAENAHLTLICPESTLENKVIWKINGRTIRGGESVESPSPDIEPRVRVDTFNTLYLYGVTREEEGNYSCFVDNTRMQTVKVFVVSKARLLTQAFVRHMMYLAFVLSLTLSCYCAGLFVTWTRRKKFKSYEELIEELKKANKYIDEDVEKCKEGIPKTQQGKVTQTTESDTDDTFKPKIKAKNSLYKCFIKPMQKKKKYKRVRSTSSTESDSENQPPQTSSTSSPDQRHRNIQQQKKPQNSRFFTTFRKLDTSSDISQIIDARTNISGYKKVGFSDSEAEVIVDQYSPKEEEEPIKQKVIKSIHLG